MLREILLNETGVKLQNPQVPAGWSKLDVYAQSKQLRTIPDVEETKEEESKGGEQKFRIKRQRKVKVVAVETEKQGVRMVPYGRIDRESLVDDLRGSGSTWLALHMDDYACEPYLASRNLCGRNPNDIYPWSHGNRDITVLKDADFAAMFSSV